jgi:hypothetical protein
MTLIAGMPHFHCVCPDGHVKPFCLSFFSQTPCCCAGSCCASAPIEGNHPRKQTSCCCHAARRQAEDQGQQVRAAGCKKTLVDAEASNVTAPARDVGQDTGIIVGVAVPETSVAMPISASEAGWLTPHHHRSPPPDLLTLLQHFNI